MYIYIYAVTYSHHVYLYLYIHIQHTCRLLLVWLINRDSLRAASCLVSKTMTCLNSAKPCIWSFTFEAVAKTCSKCYAATACLYAVGAAARHWWWNRKICSSSAGLVVAFAVTLGCFCQTDRINYSATSLVATGSRVNQSRSLKLLLAHC